MIAYLGPIECYCSTGGTVSTGCECVRTTSRIIAHTSHIETTADRGAFEPYDELPPPPDRPMNRHERRRAAAMARHGWAPLRRSAASI